MNFNENSQHEPLKKAQMQETNGIGMSTIREQKSNESQTILSPESATIAPAKFSPPYQLALINITWIFFGFSFIMRQNQDSQNVSEKSEQFLQALLIGSSLIVCGIVGLLVWKFFLLSRKVQIEKLSRNSHLILVLSFSLTQIAVMEALLLQRSIANCWVITASIVQISYVQSISRANLLNLFYIGFSTLYMVVRFQFLLNDWEWQSIIYSLLVCTVIVFHSEKVHSKTHKQAKIMISSNQKATRLNNLYYDILGMIPEGVAIFDKKQTTIFCNKTIKDLFQCNKHQLNKILLNLSTNQSQNPMAQSTPAGMVASTSIVKNQLTSSSRRIPPMSIKPTGLASASAAIATTSEIILPPIPSNHSIPQTQKQASSVNLNLSVINNFDIINPIKSTLSPCFQQESQFQIQSHLQLQIQQQQHQKTQPNLKLNGLSNEENLKVISADSNSLQYVFEKNAMQQNNQIDDYNGATFAKIQTRDLVSPSNSLHPKPQGEFPNSSNSKHQLNALSQNQPPVQAFNQSFSDYLQVKDSNNPFHQIELNDISHDLNESRRALTAAAELIGAPISQVRATVAATATATGANAGDVQIEFLSEGQMAKDNLIKIQRKKTPSNSFHSIAPAIQPAKQRGEGISDFVGEEEDESEIDMFKKYLSVGDKQVFKRRMFKQKSRNDIIQGETKVSDILGDLFGNTNVNNSFQQVNAAAASIPGVPSASGLANGLSNSGQGVSHEYVKSKTFFSQMNNKNTNLGYMQFQEDMIKVQVRWKDQIFVLKFLQFEIETADNKSEEFILVLVDPIWQEYYNKRMEEVQKYKMRMFASLSHELRTPLNCTISMLEGIEQFITDQTIIDEYLYPALHSQKLLLNQINDILDFAQIDSGKFKYTFVDFDLYKLLEDCQTLISMQATMKSLELELQFDDRMNSFVKSDPNRIRQVLLNFLSNALKFTPEFGSIVIKAEPVIYLASPAISPSQPPSPSGTIVKYIRLSVTDSGIGMKPETVKNIFNAFNKTEYENESMNSQGCGLGLAISQSIAKGLCVSTTDSLIASAAGIQVKSVVNQGSSFSFLIQDMNPRLLNTGQPTDQSAFKYDQTLQIDMLNEDAICLESNSSVNFGQNVKGFTGIDSCCICVDENETNEVKSPQVSSVAGLITAQMGFQSQLSNPTAFFQSIGINKSNQLKSSNVTTTIGQGTSQLQSGTYIPTSSQKIQLEPAETVKLAEINSGFTIGMANIQRRYSQQDLRLQMMQNSQQQQSPTRNIITSIPGFPTSKKFSSSQKLSSSNLSRSLTNQSLSKATSALGFTGYHSKINMAEDLKVKLLGALQKHVEGAVCEMKCAPVLIVDDNQFNILALSRILQVKLKLFIFIELNHLYITSNLKIPFDKAFDGQQAINKIRQRYGKGESKGCGCCEKYELIFMDLEMPILNGYEAITEVAEIFKESSNRPYVVACTAHGGDHEIQQAKTNGFDDYITKPILKQDLSKLLCDWFYQKQPTRKKELSSHRQIN